MKQKHKAVLFDSGKDVQVIEKENAKKRKMALLPLRIVLTIIKIVLIAAVVLVGSFFLGVFITSVMQDRDATIVFYEMLNKVTFFINSIK